MIVYLLAYGLSHPKKLQCIHGAQYLHIVILF